MGTHDDSDAALSKMRVHNKGHFPFGKPMVTTGPSTTPIRPLRSPAWRARLRRISALCSGFLRDEKKQSRRSVYNKFETVMTFLKANGIRGLIGKNNWPR